MGAEKNRWVHRRVSTVVITVLTVPYAPIVLMAISDFEIIFYRFLSLIAAETRAFRSNQK
jgi:hypothetical protein